MADLSLRSRIFLFFLALALGALALVATGLWVGYSRAGGDPNGYVIAGLIPGFGILGLVAGIGFLFDKHVAKPITKIAASATQPPIECTTVEPAKSTNPNPASQPPASPNSMP